MTTVRNAGIAYSSLCQSISPSARAISTPTTTSAGAVTAGAPATTANSGKKNIATRNHAAVDTAVSPVRPPALTPAVDSTYAVVVEVPMIAPAVVPTE